jgi:hypothetical protein
LALGAGGDIRAYNTANTRYGRFATINDGTIVESFDGAGEPLILSSPQSSGSVQFRVAGSEQMRLTSTGLGIGTSSPGYRFAVVGATSDATPVANFRGHAGGSDGERTAILRFTSSTDANWAVARYDAWAHLWHTNGTIKATLDSSGNLGLGVTPSANWSGTGVKAFQFQNGSLAASNTFGTMLAWNAIYDGAYKYVASTTAGMYQFGGAHAWYVAPSGTAGDAISFTQAMTLGADGLLQIGMTGGNVADGKLNVAATGTGAGTANTRLFMSGYELTSGNGAGLWFGARNNENTGVIGSRTASGNIAFETYSGAAWGERARITSGGELLVGLTSATGVALLQVSGAIRTTGFTVATLPAGTVGMRTYVTDALAPAFGVAVAGSGAVTIPVFYDGANWIVA